MNTTNSTSPAYPTFPITNGLTNQPVIFTGMTKQEQLAAQIFFFLFKETHLEYIAGNVDSKEMSENLIKAKDIAYGIADFFFSEQRKNVIVNEQ